MKMINGVRVYKTIYGAKMAAKAAKGSVFRSLRMGVFYVVPNGESRIRTVEQLSHTDKE